MTDKEYLQKLSKGQKRFLKKYECAWCSHSLDQPGCHSKPECSHEVRIRRIDSCLKKYKQRKITGESFVILKGKTNKRNKQNEDSNN